MSLQTKWAAVNLPSSDRRPFPSPQPSFLPLDSMDVTSHHTVPSTEPSSSGVASSNSTPPTSIPDSMQMDLDVEKRENIESTPSPVASKALDIAAAPRDTTLEGHGDFEPEPEAHDADDMLQAMIAQNASDPAQSIESPPTNQLLNSLEELVDPHNDSSIHRPRRTRGSVATYNLAKLSGTDVHGKRASKGDDVDARRRERRRTTGSSSFVTAKSEEPDVPHSQIPDGIEDVDHDMAEYTRTRAKSARASTSALPSEAELNQTWSPVRAASAGTPSGRISTTRGAGSGKGDKAKGIRAVVAATTNRTRTSAITKARSESPATHTRYSTRNSGKDAETLTTKLSSLRKKGRNKFEKGLSRMSRELRRLQDTNEFAHIETQPIVHTVWSNGKQVTVDPTTGEPENSRAARKKQQEDELEAERLQQEKEAEEEAAVRAAIALKKKKTKKWLDRGLYAGQPRPYDPTKGLTVPERKKLLTLRELLTADLTNTAFPTPLFNGLRMLIEGRDFKLPYDVCSPLPPGLPKPDEWRKITKNRFVGDAAAIWKKTPHFTDSSTCVCTPEDGCAEDCQNRIMLYECDDANCNVGREHCSNRAFQDLQDRVKAGGKYRTGVEVYRTEDRGYGVRSNRCFEANQIIMEYTGEIITEDECERRMNEEYKNNECYYLMSFDQNMIIDATTGSIARFVNHSCAPNCRMIKWIVSGQPRMALFAGDRPIVTGDELTYDYNFDPFSAKNVQKCLCGSQSCRGVLGPKNTKPNPNSAAAKMATAAAASQKTSAKPVKAAKGAKPAAVKPGKAIAIKGVSTLVKAAEVKTLKGGLKQKSGPTKRKLKDIFASIVHAEEEEGQDSYAPQTKKRKTAAGAVGKGIVGVKGSLSSASPGKSARETASPRGKTKGRGGATTSRVVAKRASTDAMLQREKKEEPTRTSLFSLAHFSVANATPTPDPEPQAPQETVLVEPEVMETPKAPEPASSRPSTGGALRSSGLASGGVAITRISRTLPKIIPINRNRGGDIESSTTASSVDDVPPASSAAAAAARAKAAQADGVGIGSESDRTPPRKRRRVQIPKPPISGSRSSSMTYVEGSLVTGGPAYRSPTSGGQAPVTIPSANGATLVEGKDFVPAFDDDDDDIVDLDGHFTDPRHHVHGNLLRNFDRSPRRGMDIRREGYRVRAVSD
ncbi:uncharacterized protein MKZ38_001337 [Zalerion maritima]|uniref:Histone-lysine N-methyltransferase n=1 Tax=Zalerion maritima TaxID=339359 RepID=A0AAD5RR15_9PEZI|nr:uncharacterized protein MKZ38_001337 [Zalerion maritima]